MYCIYAYGIYKSAYVRMSLAHNRHVGLDLIYMIYVRDNVVAQNAGHYRVNKPRQGGPRCEAEVSCFALKDIIFGNDRQRSIHYYTATCQNSREIVRKRRWRRLETGRAGVDNWPDYLRSNKKDLNQAKNPLSLAAVKFRMHKSTDWPIAKYCSCWCHLSKLKSSHPHPKPNGISVYMSIIVDYTTSSILHGILFW